MSDITGDKYIHYMWDMRHVWFFDVILFPVAEEARFVGVFPLSTFVSGT